MTEDARGRIAPFLGAALALWAADSALAVWFGFSEPASDFYGPSGVVLLSAVGRQLLLSFVLAFAASSALLARQARVPKTVFGAGAIIALAFLAMGLMANSMAEHYDSSTVHWAYVALVFLGGFLVSSSVGSLLYWMWRLSRRLWQPQAG